MYAEARYDDVVGDVRRELCERLDTALVTGVAADRLVVDPGLGFAEQPEHDLALLAGLDAITGLGFPVLVGASRKRFLGALLATADSRLRPPDQRDSATLATSVLAEPAGAWGVRVRDVAGSMDAVRVVAAVAAGAPAPVVRATGYRARPAPETLALTAPAREHRAANGRTERWRSA
jgi:dihydropteroate synthase